MKPLGLRPIRFPGKTKEWFGKRVNMWWESVQSPSKKRAHQEAKKEIKKELID